VFGVVEFRFRAQGVEGIGVRNMGSKFWGLGFRV